MISSGEIRSAYFRRADGWSRSMRNACQKGSSHRGAAKPTSRFNALDLPVVGKQSPSAYAESPGNPADVDQADVAFASLNAADVGAVKVRNSREALL